MYGKRQDSEEIFSYEEKLVCDLSSLLPSLQTCTFMIFVLNLRVSTPYLTTNTLMLVEGTLF